MTTDQYGVLRAAWEAALDDLQSHDTDRKVRAEEAAWDALIDYVEAHGLNYTDLDPRPNDESGVEP